MKDKLYWLQDLEFLPISVYIKNYQENCRIYFDEYPNVEEWDYIKKFDPSFIMNRFLVKK